MKVLAVLSLVVALLVGGSAARAVACEGRVAGTATIVGNGPEANRITLVLIGDGYTEAELPRYRAQALATWQALSAVEPFRTYARFFDVRRIDLVSPQSGIGGDSPLRMHFGCGGVSRLLCADEAAVSHYVGRSAGPEYVIALADSSEYGGAGGSGVTTLAAGAKDAGRIIQHEMGHTVGGLGDEYDSAPDNSNYPNLSSQDAGAMTAVHAKWWRWLGTADPSGGVVGAYRSGNGLYRPTQDSIMRTLGRPYNLPCREAIVESLYRQLDPVDGADPAPQAGPVQPGRVLSVAPLALVGDRRLAVSWTVDGRPAPAGALREDGRALDTGVLGMAPGAHATVRATVTDTTTWVRDEPFRQGRMCRTLVWELLRR